MSDNTGSDQGQQGGYPPQPPGGAAPPPPPPPGMFPGQPQPPAPQPAPPPQQPAPPAYAPPAAPPQYQPVQPPPGAAPYQGQPYAPTAPPQGAPRKRRGPIALIIVGVLLLCALVSCVGMFALAGSGGGNTDKAKQAEAHLAVAMSSVETATVQLKVVKAGGSGSTVAITAANEALRTGRDEIAAAKAVAEQMSDSQGKTDYLAALAAATKAMDGLQDLVAYAGTANSMGALVNEGAAAIKRANADMDAVISAGNANNFTRMESKAQSAADGYAKGAILLRQADKLDPSAGLGSVVAYANKRKLQAEIAAKMAAAGKRHDAAVYNAYIKQEKTIDADVATLGTPAIVKDPNWLETRLANLSATITSAAAEADKLRAQALRELGVTSGQ